MKTKKSTATCLTCGHSISKVGAKYYSAEELGFTSRGKHWPEANPCFCPQCGSGSHRLSSIDLGKASLEKDPYVGWNEGLDTYVRSRSHYKEEVRKQNVREVG